NRTIIAASSAAVVGVLAGYPFDSVKTRMQTQPYDSISACVRQTYKEEGVRGFFRGIVPPLITVSIIKSVSFSVYEKTKQYCKATYPFFNKDSLESTFGLSTTGGVVTGAFIATLSCPFELVKIQKQLEFLLQASSISTGATAPLAGGPGSGLAKKISTSSWHSAKEIIKKKGVQGLWSGFGLHFVRDALGTGVYFGGYETTKYLLNQGSDQPAGPLTQFLAGGICGILCWLVVFPIDLVKSLMQKEIMAHRPTYGSTSECIRDIYKQKGTLGFYRGITVTLVRAFPIHSLNFLVYE
ncbi:mitochondrial carrier domain-containing protein, partial [Phycomyces nitens]